MVSRRSLATRGAGTWHLGHVCDIILENSYYGVYMAWHGTCDMEELCDMVLVTVVRHMTCDRIRPYYSVTPDPSVA